MRLSRAIFIFQNKILPISSGIYCLAYREILYVIKIFAIIEHTSNSSTISLEMHKTNSPFRNESHRPLYGLILGKLINRQFLFQFLIEGIFCYCLAIVGGVSIRPAPPDTQRLLPPAGAKNTGSQPGIPASSTHPIEECNASPNPSDGGEPSPCWWLPENRASPIPSCCTYDSIIP